MENNSYDPYDFYNEPTVAWVPQRQQTAPGGPKEESFYEYPGYYARPGYYTGATQRQAQQQPASARNQQAQSANKPVRMSKAETLEVADALKKFLVIASIVGFGALSGLAASHITGVTSSQAAPSSSSSTPSYSPGSQSPSNANNSGNSGGFFNSGNQGNQGGYQFGPGNSQSPFTGSHTS